MKDNMFMALSTALLNSVSLVFIPIIPIPEAAIMAISGIGSPFLSMWLLKVYIRADDPPELTRRISGLKSAIKICEKDLKGRNISPQFASATRTKLESLKHQLQDARTDDLSLPPREERA